LGVDIKALKTLLKILNNSETELAFDEELKPPIYRHCFIKT